MNFKDLKLKVDYHSNADNVYDEFFNLVLKNSKRYSRIGGVFTSKNLAMCADGLQEFIQNNGTMELLLFPYFEKTDADAINKGLNQAAEIIKERWIESFNEIKEKFVRDHTKALAWMLANKHLIIKLMIPTDSNGNIIPTNRIENMHPQKNIGIFVDDEHNIITFNGIVAFDDEVGELYDFRIFKNWDEGGKEFVKKDYSTFHDLWDNTAHSFNVKIVSLPNAIEDHLLEIAPQSKSEINLKRPPRLRPYQKNAIDKWASNNHMGIFEMATGTGKTFTAIGAMSQVYENIEKLLVVIACPYDNLVRQWSNELKKWEYKSSITPKNNSWRQTLSDLIDTLEISDKKRLEIIITTYVTFSSPKFIDLINNCKVPVLLISDEVHNAGAPTYSKGLITAYTYRLGLSATLERYYDEYGTKIIKQFFGNVVYKFDLKKAISKKFLVGYYYYPQYIDLTDSEFIRYKQLTRTIALLMNSDKEKDQETLEQKLRTRAKIVRDAENKIHEFTKFLSTHKNMKYTIIYCSEKQMEAVKDKLNSIKPPIINREITYRNPKDPKKRLEILNDLASGKYDAITANHILDEGADIPEARECIMLASTGNPKQFIQRRGRVLRQFHGTYSDGTKKEFAKIYDFLVIPFMAKDYNELESEKEYLLIKSQLDRQEAMAEIAINRSECLADIKKIKDKLATESI